MLENGVKKGDSVAYFSKNCYEMVVVIHALHYIGAITFLLNIRLKTNELLFQLNDGHVNTIIYHDDLINDIEKLKERKSLTCMNLASFPYDLENDQFETEFDLDEVSHIIYTSGTTGNPKGVQLTYGNHWWSATASALNLGLHETDRWLLSLPMFHVEVLSILYRSVIYGMPVHLHEKFDVEAVHHDIMRAVRFQSSQLSQSSLNSLSND